MVEPSQLQLNTLSTNTEGVCLHYLPYKTEIFFVLFPKLAGFGYIGKNYTPPAPIAPDSAAGADKRPIPAASARAARSTAASGSTSRQTAARSTQAGTSTGKKTPQAWLTRMRARLQQQAGVQVDRVYLLHLL
jgi:hypothetical protein